MEILFTHTDFVVCVKPVGLDSEQEMPKALKDALGGEIFPLHRLDKNVGGLMVYARNRSAAAALSKCIQEGHMVKEYVALVHGTPPESATWKDLLFKDSRKNKVFVVKRPRTGVKEASLEFTRLSLNIPPSLRTSPQTGVAISSPDIRSLVRIKLHTGRSHQIRVQFSSRGFPLVGDHKYGSRAEETAPMLYSCALTFPHKGQTHRFEHLPPWAK